MFPKPSIICIGAGNSQIPLIKCARELGYHVIAVDRNPLAPGFLFSDVCINESTFNKDGVMDKLATLKNKYDIIGVVARTTGQALYTAAAISEELNLPGLTNELVQVSTEKSLLGNFCRMHGLPFPKSFVVKSGDRSYENEISNFPVIVKPDGSRIGKAKIVKCRNEIDAQKSISEAINLSFNHSAEIESYVEGVDSTCICWANAGMANFITWIDELVGVDSENRIIGLGESIPSVIIGTAAQNKAESMVAKLVSCFPNARTLLLISFRITFSGEPYFMEIHADLGGDLVADVLLPASNPRFNFFKLGIQIATKSIEDIKAIEFKPVTLYYIPKGIDRTLAYESATLFSNYMISYKDDIEQNLKLLPEIIDLRCLNISETPKQAEWLGINKNMM